MKAEFNWILITVLFIALGLALSAWKVFNSSSLYSPVKPMEDFYALSANTLEGAPFDFNQLRGKRLLIVNTASRCGFTPQYADLEVLHEQYGGDNFAILGFPCNDFGRQEPGTASDIEAFCSKNYGVSFQMMEKVSVKGDEAHPVYQWLCQASKNGVADHKVAWNFHKFLIDEEGQLIASLRSGVNPLDETIVNFALRK